MDALANLLDGPRARGAFLLRSVLTPPWSLRIADEAPLHRLGSGQWEKAKRKAAEQVREEFSEPVWRAFWLTCVEGTGPGEAARSLGLTIGTVYQYKSRVVARLRREIDRVQGESNDHD